MKNLEDLKRLKGVRNSFILNTEDYINYKLTKKYYIVWLFTTKKRWYEEVDLEKFKLAKKEMFKNNKCEKNIPYLLYTRYFVQPLEMSFPIEVSKELFNEINSWQTAKFCHDFYITKIYRDKNYDEYIDEIAINDFSPEKEIIHNENKKKMQNFINNNLTEIQKIIFYKIYFEGKSKSETADILGIARSTLSTHLLYIKNKLKKFLKNIEL